jgi:hypothetical protein
VKLLTLALLCLVGCASPTTINLSQCEFQPGDRVEVVGSGELGRVVAIHRWASDWCLTDVLLGNWIVEDMRPEDLRHVD